MTDQRANGTGVGRPIPLRVAREVVVSVLESREKRIARRYRQRVDDVLTGFAIGAGVVLAFVLGWWMMGVFP